MLAATHVSVGCSPFSRWLDVGSLPVAFAESIERVYDANGNLVSGDGFFREYDGLNQLVKVRSGNQANGSLLEEYVWHPLQERVLIKHVYSNGTWKESVYYINDNFVQIENSSGIFNQTFVIVDGQLIAQVDSDGKKKFIHADHLGSSSLVTNSTGGVVENTFYSPYGEEISGGNIEAKGYTGQYDDEDTGQMYYGARYYKPKFAMFVSPDPMVQNVYDTRALNRYAYAANNPYAYIDPDGRNYISLRDSEKNPFTPKGFDFSNLIPHQAGIVYNEFGAAYYSQDVSTDGSFSTNIKIGLGETVQGNPKYYEAESLEKLYEILEEKGELSRYDVKDEVETTHTQDAKILESFQKSYGDKTYDFYSDNCCLRQSDALNQANIPNHRNIYPTAYHYGTKAISYGSTQYNSLKNQIEKAWSTTIERWKANKQTLNKGEKRES